MKQPEIDYWINTMLESASNVSDLNITVGRPLQVESSGFLSPATVTPDVPEITPFQAEVFALNVIGNNKRLLDSLAATGSCDLSYWLGNKARFRVNVFSQKENLSTVLRKLPTEIPTISGLDLPNVMNKMSDELNGMILVTGATGSGKSTTLAALLHKINRERAVHVVTLEDPIEFVHPHHKATFNQRELGNDFDTFANGLRAALRQAPKVILVGEMRDRESMEIGLTAAETGHLVLSTLHTVDAGSTINRCLGMFEHDEQPQIRNRLVDTLRWVVCQRLMPKVSGGRVAAFEVLGMNLRIREVVLNGESEGKTFYEIIEDGTAMGMTTFDQYILGLFEKGLVTEQTAMGYCSRQSAMGRGLDKLKAIRGESTTGISGLAMEEEMKDGRYDAFS
ncbi:MAG: PilT/PilU family type 4a pilus ATPase [Desulfobulbaceae bacterium]|uniref:PilT/PilU family type 4a pilus ATPase n=1 Tax=Candidatus Desulfobia pelagia TaxID=2841692 RepID=A0A8J6TB26_9BACT|nr:PilT/PilU family type 4a pilus ATPase [Candidatus Desulfobia pelagia]